jgi:hypothetical protein
MWCALRFTWWSFYLCLECLSPFPAAAQTGKPTALIESVTGVLQGIEFMDYVSAGKIVSLGQHQQLVIDYLNSCLRETITGGSVTIGTDRSTVTGGSVERERVRCGGKQLQLSPEQSGKSSGMVFRVPRKAQPLPTGTVIERRLYGTCPIIDLDGGSHLLVERLDRTEERLDLAVPEDRLIRGRFYDFTADDLTLAPGGVYRATVGQRSVVFQIDRTAKPGLVPLAGRLLPFF